MLNDPVLLFYKEQEPFLLRIFTDRGNKFSVKENIMNFPLLPLEKISIPLSRKYKQSLPHGCTITITKGPTAGNTVLVRLHADLDR